MERILTELEASAMFGSTDAQTGVTIPGVFTSPWGRDRNRTDARLIDVARLGNNFRVYLVDANDDAIGIRAGRCTIAGVVLVYAGADPAVDGLTDDDTTLVWVYDDSGTATIGSGDAWPTDPHVKLAEVTMADGEITTILDRRAEAVFQVAAPIGSLSIVNADIAADAAIARSKLALEAGTRFQIPFASMRGLDFLPLTDTAGANGFGIEWSSSLLLIGEVVANTTTTNYGLIEFVLPPGYEAGSNITLAFRARYRDTVGTPVVGTTTIDAEAYLVSVDGVVGSDIVSSSAATLTDAFAEHTLTITGTGLAVGDRLLIQIATTIQETDDDGSLIAEIGSVEMRLSIRG